MDNEFMLGSVVQHCEASSKISRYILLVCSKIIRCQAMETCITWYFNIVFVLSSMYTHCIVLNICHLKQVYVRHIHHTGLLSNKVKFDKLYKAFQDEIKTCSLSNHQCKLMYRCLKHGQWIQHGHH